MKLTKHIRSNIYRDGGSLETVWQTDTSKEWALTLHVHPWDSPKGIHTYDLYNCERSMITYNDKVFETSLKYKEIQEHLKDWINASNLEILIKEDRNLFLLLNEIIKGSF